MSRRLANMMLLNGLHFDVKERKFGTTDLSPLFSVICDKKESETGSNSLMVRVERERICCANAIPQGVASEREVRARSFARLLLRTNYVRLSRTPGRNRIKNNPFGVAFYSVGAGWESRTLVLSLENSHNNRYMKPAIFPKYVWGG